MLNPTFPPRNPPLFTDDHMPTRANDCAIFIPSKGRAGAKNSTANLLAAAKVHFTLVVEPQDEQEYKEQHEGNEYAHIEVLPANNRGVSFVRNYILSHLAPRSRHVFDLERRAVLQQTGAATAAASASASENNNNDNDDRNDVAVFGNGALGASTFCSRWFWIMDDDIKAFHRTITPGTTEAIKADELLQEVYRRLGIIVAKEGQGHMQSKKLGLMGLEYQQFGFRSDRQHIVGNSYVNIAVLMNLDRLPVGIRYRFRIREDFDFALQVIRFGGVNMRNHDLSFTVPSMSTQPGGMTDYYKLQKQLDIRAQNRLFLQTWGNDLCEEQQKGADERWDVKVKWQKLADVTRAQEILLSLPGVPPRDPLSEPIPDPDPEDLDELLNSKNQKQRRASGWKHGRGGSWSSDADEYTTSDDDDDDDSDDDDDYSYEDGYVRYRGRARTRQDEESSSEEDEDEDEDDASDDSSVTELPKPKPGAKRNAAAASAAAASKSKPKGKGAAKPQPKKKKQEAPKPKPGWEKYTTQVYRVTTPEAIAASGLIRIDEPEMGMDAVIVPIDISKPVLLDGTVLNVFTKMVKNPETGERQKVVTSVQFAPNAPGEKVVNVEEIFEKPKNLSAAVKRLKDHYNACDEMPDASMRG